MVMTGRAFVVGLLNAVPEAKVLVGQHWDDYDGEVLLHLLVADVRRLSEDAWHREEHAVVRRCLDFLDLALRTGDEAVENAVAVSFVEDSRWWSSDTQDYVGSWPPALAAEVKRRRRARGGT